MNKLKSYIILISIQTLAIFIMTEIGFRGWLNFTQENSETFEKNITNTANADLKKITGRVTLGKLIKKSTNPDRVYEFMPNLEATYLGKPFRTNSFGIRDKEQAQEKPNNTKRIVGIGDSVMFGWGVTEEDRYLNLIKNQLNTRETDHSTLVNYETLNFATPGYNTTMEVATYESLASKFDGDLLILHFVENDYGIPEFMNVPVNLYSLNQSFVFDELRKLFLAYTNKQKIKKDFVGVEFSGYDHTSKKNVIKQYKHMLGTVGFRRALKKLRSLVCLQQVPVIILTGKLRYPYSATIAHYSKYLGFQVVEAAPVVEQYFEKLGIGDNPAKRKELLWINENDPHPSQLGHKLYANALLPKVSEILDDQTGKFKPRCGQRKKAFVKHENLK